MSAFMLSNNTLTIIAKYMAECANNQYGGRLGRNEAIRPIELSDSFQAYLVGKGCKDEKTGLYLAGEIHKVLVDENRKALCARYKDGDTMGGGSEFDMMEERLSIDTTMDNRKSWLASLFEVTRCYRYQIEEGDFRANPLFVELGEWITSMAFVLAGYAVDDVRPRFPKPGDNWKSWSEF